MKLEEFDATTTELLPGVNLIEASAGTGKTYAIAMLVLRFVVEQQLDIKRLLVVTFTKAASEELKDRIRQRLVDAKRALQAVDAAVSDPTLQRWLSSLALDTETIRLRLDLALLDIDQAAIFTIHGFCQRVLNEHALESGQLFDCELSGDIAAVRQNCADDFWRRQIYARPLWQVALLTAKYASPEALLASLNNIAVHQTVYPALSNLDVQLAELREMITAAAQQLTVILPILQSAFADGKFKDSFVAAFPANSLALAEWLANPDTAGADFSWLTSTGLADSLNGRKFMAGKNKALSSAEQKQQYLHDMSLYWPLFDQMQDALQQLQVAFRRNLLEYLREELDKALQQNNTVSFDQLISRLSAALTGAKGQLLRSELQQRFGAALIDEFQDTDHQQWRIFSQVFTPPHYLYLIGDPKQAIYKFRGADIFTYFAARNQAQHHYTLLHNWRSHPHLVTAVNSLFTRAEPFLFSELPFFAVKAGRNAADGHLQQTAPLVLWQLDQNPGNLPHWTSGKAGHQICQAVVNEILELLDTGVQLQIQQESRPLLPKDMAVLVRSNAQAAAYRDALQQAGIPVVLNSKQSVFGSEQALDVYTVLLAVAQPGHIPLLKQALLVSWFNLDGQALVRQINDEIALDGWISRFQDYNRLWQQQGLLAMWLSLQEVEQIDAQLSSHHQAERALTNLYHIMECLQQASVDEHLTINKTLDWLRQAIQSAELNGQEALQLRLESDEDAVHIVTLHSAKGLEYPVVFCPNLWQPRSVRLNNQQEIILCHENREMIADLGSENFSERRLQAQHEELAEDLRLFYVALTRAKYRCYLAWADVRSKDKANDSAMAYLFEFADANFAAQQQILQNFSRGLPQSFQYRLLAAENFTESRRQTAAKAASLNYRHRRRSLFTDWQMSSYTALSALSLADAPELPPDKSAEPIDDEAEAGGLPKGAQTGNVVHSLLETVSFQQLAAGGDISRRRDAAISRYGLRLDNPALLDQLLQEVVNTPLTAENGFCLKDLSPARCLQEMPFYLSVAALHTNRINRILAATSTYQSLAEKQMRGYLTGFIDLFCEYQGQYYIIDYKTNCLRNYQPESLIEAMREHNYGLQYWLYTLVVDRYLRQRLPDYRYQRDFGGVMYLFVRGMQSSRPGLGVFYDKPAEKTLQELATVFFGEG